MSESWDRWQVGVDELIGVELSAELRRLLREGLHQIGGPTRPTDALARVMGFDDVTSMYVEAGRIRASLLAGEPMTRLDWRRALVTTEIAFASSYYGAAMEWEDLAPWNDQQTIGLLRELQYALVGLRAPSRRRPDYDPEH